MIVAGVGISAFVGSRSTDFTVAVASDAARDVVVPRGPAITADDSGDTLEAVEVADAAAAREAVRDGGGRRRAPRRPATAGRWWGATR